VPITIPAITPRETAFDNLSKLLATTYSVATKTIVNADPSIVSPHYVVYLICVYHMNVKRATLDRERRVF
jgi:hypothetical protein